MQARRTRAQGAARFLYYALGTATLALGLALSAKTGLGTSPLTCVSYMIAKATGLGFGSCTFYVYLGFIVIELAMVKRGRRGLILLQIPVNFVLTQVMDLWGAVIAIAPAGMGARVLVQLLGIACTGVGSALSLLPRLVPNPGGGLVQTVSDFFKMELGLAKNVVDFVNVLLAAVIGAACGNALMGVGVGTVMAVILTGRVVYAFNRLFKARILRLCGMA